MSCTVVLLRSRRYRPSKAPGVDRCRVQVLSHMTDVRYCAVRCFRSKDARRLELKDLPRSPGFLQSTEMMYLMCQFMCDPATTATYQAGRYESSQGRHTSPDRHIPTTSRALSSLHLRPYHPRDGRELQCKGWFGLKPREAERGGVSQTDGAWDRTMYQRLRS
jgi:hypothetical protein